MKHPTRQQILMLNEGASRSGEQQDTARRALAEHLAACPVCRRQLAQARRIDTALARVPRRAPPPDLATRITAAVPRAQPAPVGVRREWWLGLAVAIAVMLLLAFAYQTAYDLQIRGVFDLISVFSTQPEIIALYPGEALRVLAESVPWLQLTILTGTLVVTAVLAQQFLTAGAPNSAARSNGHAMPG